MKRSKGWEMEKMNDEFGEINAKLDKLVDRLLNK